MMWNNDSVSGMTLFLSGVNCGRGVASLAMALILILAGMVPGSAAGQASEPPAGKAPICRPPAHPVVVQQADHSNVILYSVEDTGDDVSVRPVQDATAAELELPSARSLARVLNPNPDSGYFYTLVVDEGRWRVRAYCKENLSVVSEESLDGNERPQPRQAMELGDWAFGIRVGPKRLLVWLKEAGEGRWRRIGVSEEMVGFTLGSTSEGLRASFLTTSGSLILQGVENGMQHQIDLRRGTLAPNASVQLLDQDARIYVLTDGYGLVYRPSRKLITLYQAPADRNLAWRDSFFGPQGKNFGLFLLYRTLAGRSQRFSGVLLHLPESGQPRASAEIDLTASLAAELPDGAPRIFLRPADRDFTVLNACVVFNSEEPGDNPGRLQAVKIVWPPNSEQWNMESRGQIRELKSIDLREVELVGNSGRREHIFLFHEDRGGVAMPVSCSF